MNPISWTDTQQLSFPDLLGSNIKYSAPNPDREGGWLAVTGDATRLTAIRDTRLRRLAEGMIPPSGDTLQESCQQPQPTKA